jgi:hypothetical protein
MKKHLIFILLGVVLISCKKKTKDGDGAILPSNIQTVVSVNSGVVEVQVSAENANFYSVTFFNGLDSSYFESNDGLASYTYSESGTYTVKSRAYVTHYDFIEKIDFITINIAPPLIGPPTTGYTTPLSYPGYALVWNDEFDSPSLSSDWVIEQGNGNNGWGNNELQFYTNQNHVIENGILEIKAKKEIFNVQQYTSSRIKTQGKKSWKYGRIDVRAASPYGQGMWPAIWMLGDNISTVGWPYCGEIDIMELVGGSGAKDRTVHGTVHWEQNGHANYGGSYSLNSGKFSDNFHVFSIIWNETSIKWLVDDIQYNQVNITPAEMSEFHQNFFLILNVAVGGNWPGNPDETTVFPQSMYVDYVRVFQ